jgi:hypothetical protein
MSITINQVSIGASIDWLTRGWKLFAKQWLKCIVCLVIAHVACVILALIPIIGQIAAFFLMLSIPLCSFLAMEQIDQHGNFDLDQIFSKLKSKFLPAMFMYCCNIALLLLAMIISGAFIAGAVFFSHRQDTGSSALQTIAIILAFGTSIISFTFASAANLFAVPLLALTKLSVFQIFKASIRAGFSNLIPMFVYAIVMVLLSVLCVLTLGIGFLVLIPASYCAIYFAAKDIFQVDQVEGQGLRL